jgi:ABC-type sugar transport system permease subunit/ABC-type glycerol-3-phosphate transport system substrate-binding protein
MLLGLLLLALPFGARADVESTGRKVRLKLWGGGWGVPRKDETTPIARANRAVFEEFQKLHPEIEIVNSSGLQIQGSASESGFLLAMAGGTAPDVFYVNFRKLHTYIEQNFLYPLDEFIKKDPAVMNRVHPQIRKVITVNGHVYCLPWRQCAIALMYRKDRFRQVGLDPNRPPRNWDELYEYSKKLTDQDKGLWGFFFPQTHGSWVLTDFIWQGGGEVIQRGKDGKYRAVFNSPGGVKALKFYAKMTRAPWKRNGKTYRGVAVVMNNPQDYQKTGKLAMWIGYSYDMVTTAVDLNPAVLGMAPLPAGPTGIRANEINAGMWAMSTQIKDPRVRKAAWEYIRFMCSRKADEILTRSYVESGMWKYLNPVKLKEFGYDEYVAETPKAWLEANISAFEHGRPEPNGPNCEMIYNEMDPPMQAIYQDPSADAKKLLDAAVRRIDTKMLGHIPEESMRRYRIIAVMILLAALGLMATVVTKYVRGVAMSQAGNVDSRSTFHKGLTKHMTAWLFMAPALLAVATWAYYPLLRGMVMAFQDYRILGGSKFVGLDNFINVFTQDTFLWALLNSLKYVSISLTMGFFVPIFLAIMLAEVPVGKMFYRTLYYLPAVTSGIVIMFLWRQFYDPTAQGLFNTLIAHIGIGPQEWLNNAKMAMVCVILPGIWAGAGPGSIIYLAALKSIPDEMYEAADVDGAGIWVKIRHVVFPMLKPLIIINFVGAFIGAFKVMENVFVMTGGGPNYATHVMGLEIWYNAFLFLKFGFATAEAWIMGSMLIGFTMFQLRILKDVRFAAAGGKQ